MPINQPSNQIKLTNVSIVKLKKGGKRFEIACYKNKVQEWRNKVYAQLFNLPAGQYTELRFRTTDLDEVLQISNVFVNVSKGEVAKTNELKKAFNTTDVNTVVLEILAKGELQVGDKEREHDLTALRKELATLISEKCVDPATNRPYAVSMIDKAMTEAGFSLKADKSAKSQVNEGLRAIQEKTKLQIQRARMRIKVSAPKEDGERIRESISKLADSVVSENNGAETWEITLLIDPAQFQEINKILQKECPKGRGNIETMSFAEFADMGPLQM
ncbi:Shwachman-Bodian-diamond syndrome protein [Pterulicium gracile]|uniref:Shwachman-Bodian-diamond syndrome protein n=1 Tax=Pterulicium gracile TaxID=1884261 RepID=A0A5C3QW99_9AGAR|nr:Shwachman-Bodian-diamond syndrome protein [Pterula gracilis]